MNARFLACLAVTLTEETGYRQPVGGPYLRHANGSTQIPVEPDDRFFSDDPKDTGGRTGAGILQREFNAWCARAGQPRRDVWTITDDELHSIYEDQYWVAVDGDRLPRGVDLAVFDFAVNCGVGTAVRYTQRALGVEADGHLGQITLAAIEAADPASLVDGIRAQREAYHRKCRTFAAHGRGWLARNARVARAALAQVVEHPGLAHALAGSPAELDPAAATPPKSELPPPVANMAASSTGNVAGTIGGGTLAGTGAQVGQAIQAVAGRNQAVTLGSVLIELLASPLFWVSVVTVLGAAYIWFERRRHMRAAD